MNASSGRAAVIQRGELTETEGTRRYRVPISRAMGARDIAQYVSSYSEGVSSARRNPVGEEVIYVVNGSGTCFIDGYSYALAPGTAVYIPPGSVYQIENLDDRGRGVSELGIVSVCCPEDEDSEVGIEPIVRPPQDTKPFRTVREDEVEAIAAGDRLKDMYGTRIVAVEAHRFRFGKSSLPLGSRNDVQSTASAKMVLLYRASREPRLEPLTDMLRQAY